MKAITFTIVTKKAQSLNYGETIGNVSTLKKLTIGYDKKLITYVSDKALKYDIKRIGRDTFGWNLMDQSVVDTIKSCVININNGKGEFDYNKFYEEMVKNYQEFDLFGGMFADIGGIYTNKKKKEKININGQDIKVDIDTTKLQRTAPVRITNAYSVSEFVYDNNLLNDIDAYNRYIQYTAGDKKQTLAYSDEHKANYVYTILVDLEEIGKKETIIQLLEILFLKLNRNIRGRTENLTPVFVIGGIYSYKHPIFHNAFKILEKDEVLEISNINNALNTIPKNSGDTYLYSDNELVKITGEFPDNINIKKNIQEIINEITKKLNSAGN